jgi:ribosomal protein L40E
MCVNYELADLFAKVPKACTDSLLAKGLPIADGELLQSVRRDAAAFLLTYEQTCSALQPNLSTDDLAASLLERIGLSSLQPQRPSRQTFAYFVCRHCSAKFFSSSDTAPCPRCGYTNRSQETLVPPWHRDVPNRR